MWVERHVANAREVAQLLRNVAGWNVNYAGPRQPAAPLRRNIRLPRRALLTLAAWRLESRRRSRGRDGSPEHLHRAHRRHHRRSRPGARRGEIRQSQDVGRRVASSDAGSARSSCLPAPVARTRLDRDRLGQQHAGCRAGSDGVPVAEGISPRHRPLSAARAGDLSGHAERLFRRGRGRCALRVPRDRARGAGRGIAGALSARVSCRPSQALVPLGRRAYLPQLAVAALPAAGRAGGAAPAAYRGAHAPRRTRFEHRHDSTGKKQ